MSTKNHEKWSKQSVLSMTSLNRFRYTVMYFRRQITYRSFLYIYC